MTKEEFAARLNGREYLEEITKAEEAEAKQLGLVVIFGASDDLMEFRGAIDEEGGACGGTTAYFNADGLLQNECEDEGCPYFEKIKKSAKTIKALWNTDGYSWTYETDIPHATFDIMEDGEKYCRGIVFSMSDLA